MADIRKLETVPQMDDYAPAKVIIMGNVIEVVTRQKNSGGCPCVKLDTDHYIDTRTGEVLEYSHIDNRSESTRSIRNTLARIRALVNSNVTVPANVRWVTLTLTAIISPPRRPLYTPGHTLSSGFWRVCHPHPGTSQSESRRAVDQPCAGGDSLTRCERNSSIIRGYLPALVHSSSSMPGKGFQHHMRRGKTAE